MSAARILLADDTPAIAEMLSDHLSSKGHQVSIAADAYELVSKAAKERPHLLISDINMPGQDGSSAYHMLQTEAATKDIPVIFISAYPLQKMQSALPLGPRARFVEKPIDYAALDALVVELLPLGGWTP